MDHVQAPVKKSQPDPPQFFSRLRMPPENGS
jgi:hypothetical protein